MDRLCRWIDTLTGEVGHLVSWAGLLLVVVVCLDVAGRYLCNRSYVASRELEWHLFAVLFLLGGAHTLKEDAHVRVDVFYQRFPKRLQAAVNVLGCLLFLLPGCYLVVKTAVPFVGQSWLIREGSPDPGGIPARYLLKAMIPLAFGLMALQGLSFLGRNVRVLFRRGGA